MWTIYSKSKKCRNVYDISMITILEQLFLIMTLHLPFMEHTDIFFNIHIFAILLVNTL